MNRGIKIINEKGRKTVVGLGHYETTIVSNFKDLLNNSVKEFANKAAFRYKTDKKIVEKTYKEFGEDVNALGTALFSLGLKNKRIAIISENRYEWAISFFSIVNGIGVAVPLDKHLPVGEIENLVKRGNVDVIFYSSHFNDEMLEFSKKEGSKIEYFICMDDIGNKKSGYDDISGIEDTAIADSDIEYNSRFTSIPKLIKKGAELLKNGDKRFINAVIDEDKMSVLLFTSGTTSMSKGVMLSQRNICSDVSSVTSIIKVYSNDVHLSILPLHHTFELSAGMVFMIKNGVCIAYCEGVKHISKNLKEFDVTVLVVVPAILEAMYRRLKDGIKKSGKESLIRNMGKVSNGLRFVGIDLRRKLFKAVLDQIAPNLRLAVSGAAPLDKEVIIGFDMIGLKIFQGYGLTETSPVISADNDFDSKPGTVGHPMKGIEVAIDKPDENGMGEIITRGPNVMLGYYEDENATKEAIDGEGWLHTGDLGFIDDGGFITITGRAKSMIVLTNGKKAFPEEYEMLLNDIEGVKDSFVWGNTAPDGDIQVCAKIVVDEVKLKEKYGKEPVNSEIAEYMQKQIKNINKGMPQYKIIRYFIMTDKDLVKTTTLKIKRPIEQQSIIEALSAADTNMRKATGKMLRNS